jgi:hypothetical protein
MAFSKSTDSSLPSKISAGHWVDKCRRNLFDHLIVLNDRPVKQLMNALVHYYPRNGRGLIAMPGRLPGRLLMNQQRNPAIRSVKGTADVPWAS